MSASRSPTCPCALLAQAAERRAPVCGPALRRRAGQLGIIRDAALRARFERAAAPEEVAALAGEFVGAVRAGDYARKGWPRSMYGGRRRRRCCLRLRPAG